MVKNEKGKLVAEGEGIKCYRERRHKFRCVDTRTGKQTTGPSMHTAIRKAMRARE